MPYNVYNFNYNTICFIITDIVMQRKREREVKNKRDKQKVETGAIL